MKWQTAGFNICWGSSRSLRDRCWNSIMCPTGRVPRQNIKKLGNKKGKNKRWRKKRHGQQWDELSDSIRWIRVFFPPVEPITEQLCARISSGANGAAAMWAFTVCSWQQETRWLRLNSFSAFSIWKHIPDPFVMTLLCKSGNGRFVKESGLRMHSHEFPSLSSLLALLWTSCPESDSNVKRLQKKSAVWYQPVLFLRFLPPSSIFRLFRNMAADEGGSPCQKNLLKKEKSTQSVTH